MGRRAGYEVTLLESDSQLGGQFALAPVSPGKGAMGRPLRSLIKAVESAGIDVRTGSEATVQVIAALEPDLRDRIAVVVTVGGYYDIAAVVTFFTTGAYRENPESPWQYGTPNAYGKWVFVRANARRLDDARDRRLLRALAQRKLDDLAAPIGDLVGRLGPQGRAVMALLDNRDPSAVPTRIAALPAAIRREMAALDPSRHDLRALQATLILLHGRDDRIIPYTESLALAHAAPPGGACLTVVDNLAHVDLEPPGLLDRLRLWRAAYRLLTLRDAAPPH